MLRGGPKTAKDFLTSQWSDGKSIANEWRSRLSELRGDGFRIEYDHETKIYRLIGEPISIKPDETGQLGFEIA